MRNNIGGNNFPLGILYIIFQLLNLGINDIPFVTLITIIGQVIVIKFSFNLLITLIIGVI